MILFFFFLVFITRPLFERNLTNITQLIPAIDDLSLRLFKHVLCLERPNMMPTFTPLTMLRILTGKSKHSTTCNKNYLSAEVPQYHVLYHLFHMFRVIFSLLVLFLNFVQNWKHFYRLFKDVLKGLFSNVRCLSVLRCFSFISYINFLFFSFPLLL